MPRKTSPKLNFLQQEDRSFEDLIRVERSEYDPGPTATRMHQSLARTKEVRGGLGSGKTRSVSEHINHLCLQYPGSLHLIGRKDITSLKVTTQKEYLEKVVSPETIETFNVNDNNLYYKNRSIVLFRETKEPDKVKSLELTSYMLDECDENNTDEIYEKLDDRLRQKIKINGRTVIPPYSGFLVFNPTDEDHWLHELSEREGEIDLENFRFDTEENRHNLPPGYIENLKAKLPPWEVDRLVHGHWGRSVKGNPVFHGFTEEKNVRRLSLIHFLPLLVGWDFGYNHPAASLSQIDHRTGRYFKLREVLGKRIVLPEFAPIVKQKIRELCGEGHPVYHYCDPHGADKKDVGLSSVEYLANHEGIYCQYKREKIITGLDEIQKKITSRSPLDVDPNGPQVSNMLVDPSCRLSIAAYMGGYHRDENGKPKKDGYYDHLPDTDRYIIVNNMGKALKRPTKLPGRKPRNRITGY